MTTQHPDAFAPAVSPQAPAPETARPPSREGLLRAPVTSAGRGKRHGRRRRHHHHHREHICKYHHHHDHCRRRRCRRRRQRRRRRRRHHHHRARVRCGHSRYAFARPPRPTPQWGRIQACVGAGLCPACPHATSGRRGRRLTGHLSNPEGVPRGKALYGRRLFLRPPVSVHVGGPFTIPTFDRHGLKAQSGPRGNRGTVPMHGGWPPVEAPACLRVVGD